MPTEETRTAPLGLRVQPSLKAALERLAKEDGRTLANYVEQILKAHVESKGKASGKAKGR